MSFRDQEEFSERPAEEEEYVAEDDAIIGRALKWSLVFIVGVAGIVTMVFLFSGDEEDSSNLREVAVETPAAFDAGQGYPPVQFVDITQSAGIDFIHASGAVGDKMLPETMGGGCAFVDYDNDGDPDIVFVNSTWWPETPGQGSPPTMALYRNEGNNKFRNVTAETGLDVSFYGMGVAAGDYNGDGWVDLFITAVGKNRLFQNKSGRFIEVTDQAGVGGSAEDWGTSAGFFDMDNDGDLDLFVCNYVHWSREIDFAVNFTLDGVGRAYGPPNDFTGSHSYLYRNEGDGRFQDVSAEAGIEVSNPATGQPLGKALALHPIDLDRDGYIDILVANDTVQNFLFHNQGDGTFVEIGMESGVAFDFNGEATGAMGIDAGYFLDDDTLAIGIGNFANEMTSFYLSQEEPLWFADESMSQGIGSPSRVRLSFGLVLFDYDLDGYLDLLQANGHLEEEISIVQASQEYRQPAQLFWNSSGSTQGATFQEVPADQAGDLSRPIVGRGASYADIDGDGDLDVLLTQTGGRPLLLRNDQQTGYHWLRLKLEGDGMNRNAIGSWVYLTQGSRTQKRQVMPTRSYLSQVELPVTFGLGGSPQIDELKVLWWDGTTTDVQGITIDSTMHLKK